MERVTCLMKGSFEESGDEEEAVVVSLQRCGGRRASGLIDSFAIVAGLPARRLPSTPPPAEAGASAEG